MAKRLGQNKTIGNIAERLVFRHLHKRGLKPEKAPAKSGYDIKAGKFVIEVKGTANYKPSHFALSKDEFMAALRNKNYRLYWVNTKSRRVVKILSRMEVLENSRPSIGYHLYLSKLRKD